MSEKQDYNIGVVSNISDICKFFTLLDDYNVIFSLFANQSNGFCKLPLYKFTVIKSIRIIPLVNDVKTFYNMLHIKISKAYLDSGGEGGDSIKYTEVKFHADDHKKIFSHTFDEPLKYKESCGYYIDCNVYHRDEFGNDKRLEPKHYNIVVDYNIRFPYDYKILSQFIIDANGVEINNDTLINVFNIEMNGMCFLVDRGMNKSFMAFYDYIDERHKTSKTIIKMIINKNNVKLFEYLLSKCESRYYLHDDVLQAIMSTGHIEMCKMFFERKNKYDSEFVKPSVKDFLNDKNGIFDAIDVDKSTDVDKLIDDDEEIDDDKKSKLTKLLKSIKINKKI